MAWNNVKVAAGVLVVAAAAVGVGAGTWGTSTAAPVTKATKVAKQAELPTPVLPTAPPIPAPTSPAPLVPDVFRPVAPAPSPPLPTPVVESGIPPTDVPLLPEPVAAPVRPPTPAPAPEPPKAPAKPGKTFQVESPVGGWTREAAVGTDQPAQVTLHFDGDRLTLAIHAGAPQVGVVRHVIEADYSVNKESLVFGVVTSAEIQVPEASKAPGATFTSSVQEDQLFSFRFRVDGETLTVKDVRFPGLTPDAEASLAEGLAGRFAVGADVAAALKPEKGMRTVPRRAGSTRTPVLQDAQPGVFLPDALAEPPAPELRDEPPTIPSVEPPLKPAPKKAPATAPPPRIEPKKN